MKSFKSYLLPSVIASVFISMYSIIDGIFIGQKIGDLGLSAINIAWPITAFLQALGMSIGLSSGIFISRQTGMNNKEEANKMKSTSLIIVLALSIILGFLLYISSYNILRLFGATDQTLEYAYEYIKIILLGAPFQMLGCAMIPLLKNSGKVKTAMIASLSTVFVNLILDYILIYVVDLKLFGAAIASVIAQASAFLIGIIAYKKELTKPTINSSSLQDLALGSIAPFILNYSYSILIIITNALCLMYGSNEAVACYTLLSYMLYVVGACATGVVDAIQPLFSFNMGAKEYNKNHIMLKKCFIISFALCFILSLIFILLKNTFANLYNLSDKAINYFNIAVIYYVIGFLFISLTKVIIGYLYSIGYKLKANLLTLIEPILLTPLAYLIFCFIAKLDGVWISFLVVQIALCLLSIELLRNTNKELF